jgi:peptidoglycan hydrolase-like protein with peptidoglycan-binding domain
VREHASATSSPAVDEVRETTRGVGAEAIVLTLQTSAGNAAVARLLARDVADVDAPPTAFDIETDAPKFNEKLFKRNENLNIGLQQRVQAFVGAPVVVSWTPSSLQDLAFRVSEWQAAHGLEMTGKLDPATLAAMRAAGLTLKTVGVAPHEVAAFGATLDDRDAADLAKEKSAAQAAGKSEDEQRAAILQLAEQQVGRVHSSDRGDGKKYGWMRIHDYYKVAVPGYNDAELLEGIKAASKYPGQKYDTKAKTWSAKGGAWSWCGIFSIWAVKTVTGRGSWEQQPIGFKHHDDVANAKPGDIIHRIDDPNNQLNHHCLVRLVEGDKVTTINGNGDYQQNHVRTEPLTKYDRYWDVMSSSAATGAGA